MKTLLEDDGSTGSWDMGNGEGRELQQSVAEKIIIDTKVADAVFTSHTKCAPYRMTTTPQPAATHGGGVSILLPMEKLGKEFPDEFDENFPDDLAKCFEILRAIDALPIYIRGETTEYVSKGVRRRLDEQARRRKLIGAHIIKLQNPTQEVHFDAHAISELRIAEHNRPATRAARVFLLKSMHSTLSVLAGTLPDREQLGLTDAFDAELAVSLMSVDPKDRLTFHRDVQKLLKFARIRAVEAELFALENHDLCYPIEHLQELEYELRNCKDIERVRELRLLVAACQQNGDKNRATELSMKSHADSKWQPVFETFELLKDVAVQIVLEWEQDAIYAEKAFFYLYSLPPEKTVMSRRYRNLISEIEKLSISKTTFGWFGISDYAAL